MKMNTIIIQTGFQKISHEIIFQPQTQPKGKKLVKAGRVRNVQELRNNQISFLIQAQVIRQASVTQTPYNVKLNLNDKRKVISVSCTCCYNQSGKCKHIAAVMYYVNHEDSFTKTDFEQTWGKPTVRQFAQEKYSKGKYFCELFPPALKPKINPVPVDVSELQRPSALKTIMIEASKDQHQKDILNLMDSMLNQIDVLLAKEDCEKCLNTFFILTENYPVYQDCYTIPEDLNNYYKKYIVLSRDSIVKLNYDTLQQSECDKWFEARRQRISASINVHNIKSRKTKKIESLVAEMLRPKNINNSAVKYGRKYESVARKEYKSIYNVTVKQVGVTISDKQPWLCASLDGVVVKDSSITKIVEIKCPQSCEKRSIVDEKLKVSNISYLEFIDGKIELKKSVSYYTQCQVQMYVCGIKSCDLYIYSPIKSCCVSVFRNENFLQEVILKSESFYFQFYLPALYEASNQKTKAATLLMREKQFQMRSFTGQNIINII